MGVTAPAFFQNIIRKSLGLLLTLLRIWLRTHFIVLYGTIKYILSWRLLLLFVPQFRGTNVADTRGWCDPGDYLRHHLWQIQKRSKKRNKKRKEQQIIFLRREYQVDHYLYFPGYLWCRGGFYVQLSVATTTMEASPLTQQSRPDTFKPKIVQLYEDLFQVRQNPILSSQLNSFRKEKEKQYWLSFADIRLFRTLRRFLEGILLAESGSGSASCGSGAAQSWYYSQLAGA